MHRTSTLVLVILSLAVAKLIPRGFAGEALGLPQKNIAGEYGPNDSKEQYFRHIHSMINAYRSDMLGGRVVIETNSLVDTKYRTWKRNADIINSLLALPKSMNDAGR